MPCSSDGYPNYPRDYVPIEVRTYRCLRFLMRELDMETPLRLMNCGLDVATAELCELLHGLSEEDMARIVYDGRRKESRDLANWWEQHQEVDRQREAMEARAVEKERREAIFTSLKKLSLDKLQELASKLEMEGQDVG